MCLSKREIERESEREIESKRVSKVHPPYPTLHCDVCRHSVLTGAHARYTDWLALPPLKDLKESFWPQADPSIHRNRSDGGVSGSPKTAMHQMT